jgi:hypothetical protein
MDGIEVALASAARNFKLKVSKMDVIKIKCATIRDGEACAYLTDDHGVAPQDRPCRRAATTVRYAARRTATRRALETVVKCARRARSEQRGRVYALPAINGSVIS